MTEPGFDALIRPLKRKSFFERYFGRRTAFVEGAPDRFSELEQTFGSLSALRGARWIDAATVDADGQQRETRVEPEQLAALKAAGMTLCADVSESAAVRTLLESLRDELRLGAGPGFAKLYWSAPGRGFAMHFDPHHVWVLQLAGTKRWWFGAAPVAPWTTVGGCLDSDGRPIHTGTRAGQRVATPAGAPLDAPRRDALQTQTLTPGDVLYLPPGTWHCTESTSESRALSLSPARLSGGDVLLDLLAKRMASEPACAQDLTGPGEDDKRWASILRALQAAVADLHPSQLEHAWHAHVYGAARRVASPAVTSGKPLSRDTVLEHVEPRVVQRVAVHAADGTLVGFSLFRDGAELGMPPAARVFIDKLIESRRFAAGDPMRWDPQLTWEATQTALGNLLDAGFIRIASE